MTVIHKILLLVLPILSISFAILQPRISLFGIFRSLSPSLNVSPSTCRSIEGLEACEDAWIDHELGFAYLACSSRETRSKWSPPLGLLSASSLPPTSLDTLQFFSFSSGLSSTIELSGLPASSSGLYVHGLEGYISPSTPSLLTLFVISHRPPSPRSLAPETGAESVIEIFELERGRSHANWVGTVESDLIVTPNNLVATGGTSFFVSNDHKRKVHWSRKLEMVYSEPSSIVHCDASRPNGEDPCIVALDGIAYPNGIAQLPNSSTLFVASTMTGEITTYEIQSDYTLFPLPAKISLNRPIDNIHVSPSTSSIYASTFPKMLKFMSAAQAGGLESSRMNDNPVEIWRIEEEKGEGRFYGHQYKSSLVLSDPENEVVSSITTAAPFENKLLLTGYFTERAVVCEMPEIL